jgi:tetratricopeptide (TPR) repeat protein
MPSEPVPLVFQLYFYSAIVMTVLVSLSAIVLYRRAVRRNMLTSDASDPVLPTTAVDDAAVRAFPTGPSGNYAVAEHRLKIRLALIYSAAILGIALLAVWIRFFSGNTTLIRGSIMFMMWRGYLGSSLAAVLSAALVAAIGIPLLAVLLAWNWRRAAAVFVVYVGVWAVITFALLIVLHGWSTANWAGTLVLAQFFLVGIIAPQPFLLLLITGNRRVRAVAPMTLAGSLVFCAVVLGAFFLTPEVYRLQLVPTQVLKSLGHSGALFIIAGALALFVCWCLLLLLARLYERKVYSDRQLLVDCWSLVIILYVFARLGETPGTPQLLIAIGFIGFLVYRLLIQIALLLLVPGIERPPNRRLLLLRTFGFQKRTEGLFDAIGQRWRFHGAVLMIAGTDLAARTINPADYLRFLGRRLRHRFIRTNADLQRNLERLDDLPDPDGRYRINELFCGDHTWYKALVALLDRADVVLMDLRGFGPNNSGCVFELQQLVERGPVGQVFLTVDDTTDRPLLDLTIQDAWSHMPDEARRDGAADLIVLPMAKHSPQAMAAIFVALQGLEPAKVLTGARGLDSSHEGDPTTRLSRLSSISPEHTVKLEQANARTFLAPANTRDLTDLNARNEVPLESIGQRQASPRVKQAAARPRRTVIALLAAVTALLLATLAVWAHWGAIGEYTQTLALKPDSAEVHNKLGLALDRKGEYEAAIAEFRKALAVKPDLADAHYNLGVNLDHKGDYEAAIAEYRKALAVDPDLADAHYNLGADLDHKGDYEAATAEYRKALAVDPDLADAHYNLGVDLDRKGDYEAAVGEYGKALALKADDADAHYNLGVDLIRKDDSEGAIAEFRKALALKPDWADAHINLGGILFRKGDYQAAIAEFRKAIAAKPNSAQAHNNLAIALYYKGDYEAAIAEFRRALAIKSDYANAHNNLALALHAKGRSQEAEREFQEARRLDPALKRPWN